MPATDLLKYLSQACKLLNVLISVPVLSCLPLLLLTLFSIPRPQVSLIEVEPISPYTVFTQTQSSAVLFSPPSPSSLETFLAPAHLQTSAKTHTHARNPHIRLITHWRFHGGRRTASHRNMCLLRACGGASRF